MNCKSLDAQVVRPDDAEFARLLGQFVPVRVTSFKGVDMNFFRFDYDQTFAVLLMDAKGTTYSRFGTNDHKADASRMSIPGLKRAMRAALKMHNEGWQAKNPVNAPPLKQDPFTLADIPAYTKSKTATQPCAHCHHANDYRFAQLRQEGKFSRDLLFQYPFPENIGIALDVNANNLVKSVLPDSPAQKAGVQAGDIVTSANDAPVLTSADLQMVLNGISEPGAVSLVIERNGQQLAPMSLALPQGWRKSDISWRPSQAGIPPQLGIWAEPLNTDQKKARGIEADKLALRVSFLFPGPKWATTRGDLKMNDVILDINDKQLPGMNTRQFHSYFRLNFNVGDTATLTVLRGQEKLQIKVPCLDLAENE
ncbi:MAG TPA: Trx7/PDZ domain-containing (seleno)protein [Abditibacteriaceae bacterium]